MLTGRHVMIDGETLGTGKQAAFLQLGACEFFPEEKRIGDTFSVHVDLSSSLAAGRMLDPGAFLFWLEAGREAQQRLASGLRSGSSLVDVLVRLGDFCRISNGRRGLGQRREEPAGIWSHGLAFDVAMLEDTYASVGLEVPWHHRTPLDTRTIFRLAGLDFSSWCAERRFEDRWPQTAPPHVAHDGLSDAIAQALAVMDAEDRLRRVG